MEGLGGWLGSIADREGRDDLGWAEPRLDAHRPGTRPGLGADPPLLASDEAPQFTRGRAAPRMLGQHGRVVRGGGEATVCDALPPLSERHVGKTGASNSMRVASGDLYMWLPARHDMDSGARRRCLFVDVTAFTAV